MISQANAVGGSVHVVSAAGKGTLVVAELPLTLHEGSLQDTPPVRLLIVEDDDVVRLGLRVALSESSAIAIVGDTSNIGDAVAAIESLHPDIVLLEAGLRYGDDSAAALRAIHASVPACRVIMLTAVGEEADGRNAVSAGALGYVLKDQTSAELATSICRLAAHAHGDTNLRLLPVSNDRHADVEWMRSQLTKLSEQEVRVLQLVAEGRTNREIAASLVLSEHTVRTYVSHIFNKLHVKRRAEAAAVAARQFEPLDNLA
jgi:DNA-binding NarL/FixJ family response regulator